MRIALTESAATPEGMAGLLNHVARAIGSAAGSKDDVVEIAIEGNYRPAAAAPSFALTEDLIVAGREAGRALSRLRRRGGMLASNTRGSCGGLLLELALMADLHLMEEAAELWPSGLFDGYVPCAGGWSRMIESAGAGRSATLLRCVSRVGAREALAAGLCDATSRGTPRPPRRRSRGRGFRRRRCVLLMSWPSGAPAQAGSRHGRLASWRGPPSRWPSRRAIPAKGSPHSFEGRPARFGPPNVE